MSRPGDTFAVGAFVTGIVATFVHWAPWAVAFWVGMVGGYFINERAQHKNTETE